MKIIHHKPTKEELLEAKNKTLDDIIDYNLNVLFCGINPGLYTAAIGRHFGRPGNRFWPSLYNGGFTPRLLSPYDEYELLEYKLGITNVVSRATNTAAELTKEELIHGFEMLEEKIEKYKPQWIAVLGIGSYRKGFNQPNAVLGKQDAMIKDTRIWLLPNPSGLNAHFTPKKLAEVFALCRAQTLQ